MDVAGRRSHVFGQRIEIGVHIVLDPSFDLGHAFGIDVRSGLDGLEGVRGNASASGERSTNSHLDAGPSPVAALLAPDLGHLGSRVAGDHVLLLSTPTP